jgi:hypothetical protein
MRYQIRRAVSDILRIATVMKIERLALEAAELVELQSALGELRSIMNSENVVEMKTVN